MRAEQDSITHQKKMEKFLKVTKDMRVVAEMNDKFNDILVKHQCLEADDPYISQYIAMLYLQ